ncbi:MAG: universal stress protein [Thermoanaerobaculia bacterium]
MLTIRKVLFPTDFSQTSRQALDHALALADVFGAELHLVHVLVFDAADPLSPEHQLPNPDELYARLAGLAASEMSALLSPFRERPLSLIERTVRATSPADAIVDYASREEIDLIVMGTHGRRGAKRLWMGSVATEVLRHAPCSVVTLRDLPGGRGRPIVRRIVAPVDFSEASRHALTVARELARATGAELEVLHVVEPPPPPTVYGPFPMGWGEAEIQRFEEQAEEALARLTREVIGEAVPHQDVVRSGSPAATIAERAAPSDWIVEATHGRHGIERWVLGSVAEAVARSAAGPVWTLRQGAREIVAA